MFQGSKISAAEIRSTSAPLAARGGGGEPGCRYAAYRRGPGRRDAAGFGRRARRARRCQAHLKEEPRCCGCGRVEREQRLKKIFHILDPETWIFHILDPETWIFHILAPTGHLAQISVGRRPRPPLGIRAAWWAASFRNYKLSRFQVRGGNWDWV